MKNTSPRYQKLAIHLGIHLVFIILLTCILQLNTWDDASKPSVTIHFLQVASGYLVVLLPPVYVTVYGLLPHFLIKKRYLFFGLGLVSLTIIWGMVASYVEPWMDEHWFGEPTQAEELTKGVTIMAFFLTITILVYLSYRWFIQQSRIKQMENDRLHYELSLLKNQINPHFFFNTLNNLYALSLEQSQETPQVILKLSEMMRYAIYDCKETFVAIQHEVNYLNNYIALQQIRHDQQKQITFIQHIEDKHFKIAPMLMIVFLENAFKHGVEILLNKAFVSVELIVNAQQLIFTVKNNFDAEQLPKKVGGVGLENVRRRLALLYPNKHQLETQIEGDLFQIQLKIDPI